MTNLERARQGERLKVEVVKAEAGQFSVTSLTDDYEGLTACFTDHFAKRLADWVNIQIDYAVTHAIDDTEELELWRDLKEGEVYQEEDRILLDNQTWTIVHHRFVGKKHSKYDDLAQRRVRKEDL